MLLIQKVVFSGCVRAPRGHHLRQDVRELRLRPESAQLQQGHQTWGGSNVQLQLQLLKQKKRNEIETLKRSKNIFFIVNIVKLNYRTKAFPKIYLSQNATLYEGLYISSTLLPIKIAFNEFI
jgi:hypothetical protein